jgi:transposase
VIGIQAMVTRYENVKLTAYKIKTCHDKEEEILQYVKDSAVRLAIQAQLKVLHCIVEQIELLEKNILEKIKNDANFDSLKKIPGIGPILAMTILLETGNINRFKGPGNYSSYCRCVESKCVSNAKKKGQNNRKNGNAYLGWAFVEAANYAIRFSDPIKKYYQRKLEKTKRVVAIKTISNKLSKATYFILRDQVEFDMKKLFN